MASVSVGRVDKLQGVTKTTSLHKAKQAITDIVNRLKARFEIEDDHLVRNIVAYAKSLTVPRTSVIDQSTFIAQMINTFGITDMFLLDRIFHTCQGEYSNVLAVEEFARVICIFATPEFIYQAMFAFNVYDFDNNDILGLPEYIKLLRPCVAHMTVEEEEDQDTCKPVEHSHEGQLAVMLLGLFGKSFKDPEIDRFEWYNAVRKENMLTQCLGICLPLGRKLEAFLKLMDTKDPYEIAYHYQHERKRSLREPELPTDDEPLYPVMLEFDAM